MQSMTSCSSMADLYGRAAVVLTRAVQLTYILSPIDVAGLPGMVEVLAVHRTGCYTLR